MRSLFSTLSASLVMVLALAGTRVASTQSGAAPVPLPNRADSFKFAVLGDSGTGEKAQYELADQMVNLRERFNYGVVLLLGGNIYGSERPRDFVAKFEQPYKRLLETGVTFRAALGNDDAREQRHYKHFTMEGKTFYAFEPRPGVQFLALDSTDVTAEQIEWVEAQLRQSRSPWKIAYLHHPLYSSRRTPESKSALRARLEPLFIKYNVSVVFSANQHVYERTEPQNGITYFVVGSGGKLDQGGVDRSSSVTASGFDRDQAFLAAEVAGDRMYFNAVSRAGQTVDSGVIVRRN